MRARGAILDVHRSTEHDQPAITIEFRLGIGLAFEVDELDAMPALTNQLVERAERFGGDVLEDEYARHVRSMRDDHAKDNGPDAESVVSTWMSEAVDEIGRQQLVGLLADDNVAVVTHLPGGLERELVAHLHRDTGIALEERIVAAGFNRERFDEGGARIEVVLVVDATAQHQAAVAVGLEQHRWSGRIDRSQM